MCDCHGSWLYACFTRPPSQTLAQRVFCTHFVENCVLLLLLLLLLSTLQVFGLHSNADISYYTASTKAIWSNLVDLQPRVGHAAGGVSREAVVSGVAHDIAARLPEQFDLPLLAKGMGAPTPTEVVLLQELARWNGVLDTMSTSLRELQRALSGGCQVQRGCRCDRAAHLNSYAQL